MSVNMGTAIGYLDLDTSKFKSGFKSALADLKVFKSETATGKDKLAAFGSAATSSGRALTKGLTLPLAGVGAAAVGVTAKFDAGMSKVQAISGATGKEMDLLRDKAKEMGAKTKFSATESAEAMNYMAMAGWKTEDMLNGLDGIMNLAAASGEDLATTSDIVTDALTAFGLSAKDSTHFADVLAAASSNANTNVSMMGESFKYVGSVAGSLGYSAEDISVALGLMANSGVKASQAGTTLRGALTRMAKPTGEVQKTMDKLGITLTDANGEMLPFRDVMEELREKMGGLSKAEQAAAATTLFGKNAMSGMLAVVNASEKDWNKLTGAIDNADGSSEKMAKTMMDNLPGALTLLKSAAEGLGIRIGEVLTPTLTKIVNKITEFVAWLTNASDRTVKFAVVFGVLLAAIGPVLLVLGTMARNVLSLAELYGKLSSILQGKTIGAFLSSAKAKIVDTAATVKNTIANSKLGGAISKMTAPIKGAISRILALAAAHKVAAVASLGIIGAVVGIGLYMKKTGMSAQQVADKITKVFSSFVEKLPEIASNIAKTLTTVIPKAISSLTTAVPKIVSALVKGISSSIVPLAEAAVQIIQALGNALIQNIPVLLDAGLKLVTGLVTGLIKALPQLVTAALKLILGLAESLIKNLPKIVSAAVKIGVELVKGIIKAIPQIIAAGVKIIQSLWKGITGKKPWLLNMLKGLIRALPRTILTIIGSILSAGIKIIQSLWNGIKKWWSNLKSNLGSYIKKIPGYFASAVTGLFTKGMELVQGLWNGWKKKWAAFKQHLDKNSKAIGKTFQRNYNTGSPSRWFHKMGTWLVQGLENGWNEAYRPFLENVGKQANAVKEIYSGLSLEADMNGNIGAVRGTTNPAVKAIQALVDATKSQKVVEQNNTNNITVNGGENPEEFAVKFVDILERFARS